MGEITVFDVVSKIVFWSSPAIFLVGVLLVLRSNYRNLENVLSREKGLQIRIMPKLENNIFSFQEWLLKRNNLIGLILVVCSLIFFFTLG